ncbi:interleukin-6 receptor subunit alpha isoform X2 [Pezoporus wallicus]|uniref:interleukin-6 receptor subunit alpha isoform X2 n=1 Tax=Pezoporus wallicus TaxID=35540 RepID=UPI00254F306B|nr:interleukin-6 receptor subunit alpha isoform X2 [Pezoporus wallicus]XP_061333889.1 interleukin-6 receptor subunit alpha isoform X2 [Pezoporus flaviventris]
MSCCLQPLIFLLFAAAAAPRQPCGPLGLSHDTVLGRPGANITLRCWDEGPGNVTVSWRVEEWGRSQRLPAGNALPLHRLRHEDAGTYSCFVGSHRLRSLRLLVQEPPETPRVSCYRRSHDHDVLCEWPLRAKPSPGTRAMLWVKQRFTAENATEQRCRFFSKSQKFVCRVKVPRGADDIKPLLVSTCVSNGAGSAAGEDKIITLNGVLRPDPPLNVTVTALEKAPQRLRVNWSYPSSWDHRFYWLRFQVRYRPEPARTFSEVDQVTTTWLDIHDAWRGLQHVVQVRAQEEFGHGAWSEWSREAVGAPWTDPKDLNSEMGFFSSQFPMEDGTYGLTLPPELFVEDGADGTGGPIMEASARSTASPYTFLVAGGSLLLGIALCIGIVLRYRQLWWMDGWRGAKPEGEGQHVLVPLGSPSPPPSDTPLLSSPCSPASGGLHVTSLDYFFSGQ